jgi:molecular chaperone GrpE (heat shock protein)
MADVVRQALKNKTSRRESMGNTVVENSELKADAVEQPNAEQAETAAESSADQLRTERDQLKAERDDLKELLLRRQAEFDNFRKRTEL